VTAERSLSTKIDRPALAAVLARLTGKPPERFANVKAVSEYCVVTRPSYRRIPWAKMPPVFEAQRVGKKQVRVPVKPSRTMTGGDALAELYDAGLYPWQPGDGNAPKWWCEWCCDSGWQPGFWNKKQCECVSAPRFGNTVDSIEFESLVAVASLGGERLLRYVALCDEIVRGTAIVKWRVRLRDQIDAHHRGNKSSVADKITTAVSREETYRNQMRRAKPNLIVGPWCEEPFDGDGPEVCAAWPMLREIHEHADHAPTGVHLIEINGRSVTLAVEAV
jgi:hypothetical protein